MQTISLRENERSKVITLYWSSYNSTYMNTKKKVTYPSHTVYNTMNHRELNWIRVDREKKRSRRKKKHHTKYSATWNKRTNRERNEKKKSKRKRITSKQIKRKRDRKNADFFPIRLGAWRVSFSSVLCMYESACVCVCVRTQKSVEISQSTNEQTKETHTHKHTTTRRSRGDTHKKITLYSIHAYHFSHWIQYELTVAEEERHRLLASVFRDLWCATPCGWSMDDDLFWMMRGENGSCQTHQTQNVHLMHGKGIELAQFFCCSFGI